MSLNKIFSSFTEKATIEGSEKPPRKVSLIRSLLTPALKIFSKISEAFHPSDDRLTRLTDIEKKELLKHSILRQEGLSKDFQSGQEMTTLLGQIHADALAVNNSLEHLPSHMGAKAWADLTREVKEIAVPKELQEALEQYKKTSSELSILRKNHSQQVIASGQKIARSIYKLKKGESFLLEGGRRKNSIDYPIVFEFIRVSDDDFDLYVYLPGNNKDIYHEQIVEKDRKAWNRPIIHYQNIPAETHLFFGKDDHIKSDFFQAILEARFSNKVVSTQYATLDLLSHLQSFRNDADTVISERMARTDAWSSLKPFLLRKLGKEKYKKLIFEIKLNSLVHGYNQAKAVIEKDIPESETLRIVLKRGAKLLLKNLASFQKTEIKISEDLFLRARATAIDLIDELDRIEKGISTARKEHAHPFSTPKIDKANLQSDYIDALEAAKKTVRAPFASDDSIHSTRARLINLSSPEQFPEVIEAFIKEYDSSVKVVGIQTAEIEHLVSLMPVPNSDPSSFWNKIPPEKLLSTLSSLDKMIVVYAEAMHKKKPGITAKQSNIAYTLYAIVHHLAVIQDRIVHPTMDSSHSISLSHYPIHFPGMEADNDPFLLFTSPDDYTRRQELIAYFKNSYVQTSTYGSRALFHDRSDEYKGYHDGKSDRMEEYLLALANDPRFQDQLSGQLLEDTGYPGFLFPLLSEEIQKKLLASKLTKSLNIDEDYHRRNHSTLLFEKGFGHLPLLARSATIAQCFTYNQDSLVHRPRINSNVSFDRKIFGIPLHAYFSVDNYYFRNPIDSSKLHPVLRDDQKGLLKKEWIRRKKMTDTSKQEAEVLRDIKVVEKETTEEIAFLRASCEPSLFPSKLLSYYRTKLELFESFQEQTLFELALFRSVAQIPMRMDSTIPKDYQSIHFFPVADEMKQKGFQNQAKLFIQEGIDRYFFRQPNQKPKVLAATLFLRLACRLSRFIDGTPWIDSVDLIEKMISVPSITQEEKSLLSLHLIQAYGSLNRVLTKEEVEKVFGAWIYYKNTPFPEGWQNPLLEGEVETFIHKVSTSLQDSDSTFQSSILKTALKQLGVELPASFTVSARESHLIEGRGGGSDFWTVNVLTGEVMTGDGILRRAKAPKNLHDQVFRHIFGEINPSYFETNSSYYFSHPTLGTFRAVKNNNNTYGIQKLIGSQWYQYVSPDSCLEKIPRFLCGNNTHWINIDRYSFDMIICSRETGEIVAMIDQTGLITSKDRSETYYGISGNTFLTTFERPEYIHWTEKNGKKTLNFWRYQSHSHQSLSFEQEGNSLVFTANRKYVLSQKQKPGLLGAKNGSLVLVHRETGEEKVIVSFRPLESHTPLSTQHEIDVADAHVKYSSLGEYYEDQKNKFAFLEFDVKQGSLIPLSQEGTLYLNYQYLAQRRYAEAYYWLKQIDFRDQFSKKSQYFLHQTIGIAGRTDTSPEAAAVALHAWVLFKKASKRMQAEDKPFDGVPNCGEICKIYSRFEHQIPENLLLNAEDRDLCKLTHRGEKQLGTYTNIKTFLPSPLRGQEEIRPLEIEHADVIFGKGGLPIPSFISQWQWESIVRKAKEAVEKVTEFIPSKPIRSNFDEDSLLINDWTLEFEQGFFLTAYEIARGKQGTPLDRRRLIFKMQAISDSEIHAESWKYLQLALNCPDEVPDLPALDNHKARLEFVNRCAELSQKTHQSNSLPTKDWALFDSQNAPTRPIEAPIFPARTVEETIFPLKLLPFSKEIIDDGFTEKFFDTHFTKRDKNPSPQIGSPICPDESSLQEEEKEFLKILQAEFKEFSEDYKKGVEINTERQFYDLKNPQEMRTQLEAETTLLDSQLVNLESSILELANKHDLDKRKKTLYKEVKIEQELSLKRLADLFLQGDAEAFAKANSYLRNEQLIKHFAELYQLKPDQNLVIDYLYNQIGLYMTVSVHKARLQRSIKLCKEIERLNKGEDLKRDAMVQKLAEELKPISIDHPVYSIKDHPEFLVFEFLSGLSIRQQQVDLLIKLLECKDERYINRVIQLIMGGGKTSVMAVILLKLAAKKGRLSLFVTPASQYASVSYNLRKTLRDCFGIDMEEIDVTREQLAKSSTMCDEILARLQNAIKAGNFLLIKSETLQTISLEFIDFIYQAAKDPEPNPELINKINTLKDILLLFRERGDALFDEVDLLLNVLQEMNFPVGDMEHVAPERIEVIRQLFLLFMGEKVSIDQATTVNLAKLIGLRSNRQNLLSKEEIKATVAKAVAYNLSRTMESLKLQGRLDFCDSFERYINGTMTVDCQRLLDHPNDKGIDALNPTDRHDYEFLNYVKTLRNSSDPNEQEAAHHIALIKHMMLSVLPITFEKTGKRNYGRGGLQPGEVRPYLAVDTPSENLFGYHWEAVAYYFQTALQCGISKEQMLYFSKVYKEQAEIEAEREKKVFDRTIAAIEFKDLTGVALHELDDPKKVDEAIVNLNNNIDALLRFEADTAAEYVSYYPLRLTATGQSLVRMLCTVRAMSGTPWNVPCYPSSLSKNFEPAVGTEGQIAEALLSRAAVEKKEKQHVHVIQSKEITAILKELLGKHPQKDRVRILMDSGALFKNYSNIEVATAIRDYLGIPVLFFMRNPHKNEKTPDTLAVLKIGSSKPDIIGGTRLEDIQKTGLNLEDYFVFADERHTTGTDLPLIPDVIGLMTMDEAMLRRSLFQTIMRERDFFLNQEVEFVIPEYLLGILKSHTDQKIDNEGLRLLLANLILSIKNQAIAKSKHYFRSCKQKIDAIFRQNLLDTFVTKKPLTHDFIQEQFPFYQGTTLTSQSDNPYDQFGALEYSVDSLKSLEAYRDHKLSKFPLNHPQRNKIEQEIQSILDEAKASSYMPATVLEAGSRDLGMQVDVLTEVSVEVEQETEQEIEQEILQELQIYQQIKIGNLKSEKEWQDREIESFLDNIRGNKDTQLKELSSLLSGTYFRYQQDYSKVFSSGIRVTDSWIFATERYLPVFHKMQRPLDQLLIVKNGKGYEAIALSQNEARQFKSFLERNQNPKIHENVWMIQSDGTSLQDTLAQPLSIQEKKIQEFLIECNVFNGRIDYLDSHEQHASAWLHEDNDKCLQIKKHFLKLKVANQKSQKRLFFKSEVFGNAQMKENQKKYRWKVMASETETLDKTQIQAFTAKDAHKFKWLLPKQLNMIKVEQVQLLGGDQIADLTEPPLIQEIPEKYKSQMHVSQMKHIAPKQVAWFKETVTKTQAMPARYCQYMDDEQIKLISPFQVSQLEEKDQLLRLVKLMPALLAHVTDEQVKKNLIDENMVPHLRNKEAIQELSVKWLHLVDKTLRQKYLKESQVVQFTLEEHKQLIEELTEAQQKWLDPKLRQDPTLFPKNVQHEEPIQVVSSGRPSNTAIPPVAPAQEKRSITSIVLSILGIIVATGILVAGAFALMGALWPHAPQFTIVVFHAFNYSPLILPCLAAGGGTIFLVGLVAYAINQCRHPKRPRAFA